LDSSLVFVKNSNILCVIPAVLQKINSRNIWNSHAYSTYGGFVVSDKFGVEDAIEVVDLTIQFAAENNIDEIIVRNPFRIFNKKPTDETDYAMYFKGFKILSRDVEIVLPLKGFAAQTIDSLYEGKTRNAVRKAEKENIKMKLTKDYPNYWQILSQNLAEKHETKPTHTLEQFQILESLVGDEKIKLFGAYLDEKLIAGMIIFVANNQAIHTQYIAGLNEFQHLRPINLLIHRISIWAINNNFQYFNLGMSTNPDGSGINSGLSKFKEGFGGRSVLRETMQLILK
jgi:peptidoglycan hydrolase-like protein with peptidoglycan-binding domain